MSSFPTTEQWRKKRLESLKRRLSKDESLHKNMRALCKTISRKVTRKRSEMTAKEMLAPGSYPITQL